MVITIQIATNFRYYISDVDLLLEGVDLEVSNDSTVRDVLEQVHFPQNITFIVFINGHSSHMDTKLMDYDRVYLATPMVGG